MYLFFANKVDASLVKIELNLTGEYRGKPGQSKAGFVALHWLKDQICFNQGQYVQYEYFLGERHRVVKDLIKSTDLDDQTKTKKLKAGLKEFERYAFDELNAVTQKNMVALKSAFLNRKSTCEPRVCLKASAGNRIKSALRLMATPEVPEHLVDENTGFQYVSQNGKYFLCNDLPALAVKGEYVNPRLDEYRVRSYVKKKRWFGEEPVEDQDWVKCWRTPSHRFPDFYKHCYKSTLIVPMTLKNNPEISDEFKREFFRTGQGEFFDRMIWGFLCLDHPSTGYFNDSDIELGYIYADLLSLYYITYYIHVVRSRSVEEARVWLADH